jgi:hypothetical protein
VDLLRRYLDPKLFVGRKCAQRPVGLIDEAGKEPFGVEKILYKEITEAGKNKCGTFVIQYVTVQSGQLATRMG